MGVNACYWRTNGIWPRLSREELQDKRTRVFNGYRIGLTMDTKKKKRFIKRLFIALAMVLVIYLTYKGYERWPSQNWKEYRSLVRIWPRLKKEEIKSIRFTQPMTAQAGLENETFFQEIVTTFSFRVRKEDDINSWVPGFEVPKENLPECVKIIDKAMKGTSPSWGLGGRCIWLGRMLIITDKGKYIAHVETDISKVAGPKVYGEEWVSCELGKFLAKYCFPHIEHTYFLPPKEQTVAILLYPPKFSLPLVIFGDKKLAEKLLFETEVLDGPNGLKGIGNLYKFTQLRKFGIKTKKEAGEIVFGKELEPKKIFKGRNWLEKIMDAYEIALKEAEEKGKYYPGLDNFVGRIVFMTRDGNYWKEIGISDNAVYDDYIESEQLKAYFDELGLVDELLAEKLSKGNQN